MEEEIKKEQPKKSVWKKVGKISAIVGLSIVGLFTLVFAGGNALKFLYYREFISLRKNIATIPGLNTGAVPQGITACNGGYIMSMYMKDGKSPSRIYVMDKDKNSRFVELYEDDEFKKPCTRHCGGVQYIPELDNKIYVAAASVPEKEVRVVFSLDYEKLMNKETTKMKIGTPEAIDNEASSIYSDGDYVYVSEFNKDGSAWYITNKEHYFEKDNEKHKALISKFKIDKENRKVDFSNPICYYSIPDLVQGVAIKNNFLYTSTSWGLASSHISKYDLSKSSVLEKKFNSKDVYFVGEKERVKSLKCPPMFEDLDIANIDGEERIITYNESASNKYIFGKFFFNNKIVGIKLF